MSDMSTLAMTASRVGIALGRALLIDEDQDSGGLVPLVRQARIMDYGMRQQSNQLMSGALQSSVEFLVEEGRAMVPLRAQWRVN